MLGARSPSAEQFIASKATQRHAAILIKTNCFLYGRAKGS